jgi:hypothetical protein
MKMYALWNPRKRPAMSPPGAKKQAPRLLSKRVPRYRPPRDEASR